MERTKTWAGWRIYWVYKNKIGDYTSWPNHEPIDGREDWWGVPK